jgi:hypothetical protein
MVLEELSAFTHGRIPAHEFEKPWRFILLLQAKAHLSRHHFLMFEIDVDNCFDVGSQQSMVPVAARSYMFMLSNHFMSYN